MTPSRVLLTHPDKLLWPADGITKADLAAYYERVAPVLLPHVRDRPLVMRPFPQGISGRSFYRQSLPRTAPGWLPRFTHVTAADGRANLMPLASCLQALLWLVNQAAIELHPWLSRIDEPAAPDFLVFDLDIVRAELFPLALEAALLVRGELRRLGLAGYPKTSGGDGLHIYVPLARGPGYDDTHRTALTVARSLETDHPRLISTDPRPARRKDRVMVDYAQNAKGHTTVAVYSVRPRPGAPVSMPLRWEEVEQGAIRPAMFTIATAPQRLDALGELFSPVLAGGQRLPPGNGSGAVDARHRG